MSTESIPPCPNEGQALPLSPKDRPCPAWCVATHEPPDTDWRGGWTQVHQGAERVFEVTHGEVSWEGGYPNPQPAAVLSTALWSDDPRDDEPRQVTLELSTDCWGHARLTCEQARLLASHLLAEVAAVEG